MRVHRPALAMLLPLLLAGCGLRPLYADGSAGSVAQTLATVEVAPIGGQSGWLVRNALNDRLHHQPSSARYRLEVELDDKISGFGTTSTNNAITRERRILRARYRLVDSATGGVLLDQSASADAGLDVAGSEYATVAAEQTALERLAGQLSDQIVARVATFAKREADKATPQRP